MNGPVVIVVLFEKHYIITAGNSLSLIFSYLLVQHTAILAKNKTENSLVIKITYPINGKHGQELLALWLTCYVRYQDDAIIMLPNLLPFKPNQRERNLQKKLTCFLPSSRRALDS